MDFVKLNSSFLRGLGEDPREAIIVEAIIVEAIISLAHSLELEVVGEGLETSERLEHLRSLGATSLRGHHLAEPLPGKEVAALLADKWEH